MGPNLKNKSFYQFLSHNFLKEWPFSKWFSPLLLELNSLQTDMKHNYAIEKVFLMPISSSIFNQNQQNKNVSRTEFNFT